MTASRHHFLRSSSGTAAIEFAMIVPMMLLLMAGIAEFGSIFKVYNQTNRLASQYAIAWSDCAESKTDGKAEKCATELALYTTPSAIANVAPQLQVSNVTLQMFQVLLVGNIPTVMTSYPTATPLSPAQTSAAQASFTDGQIGVIVHARYDHSLRFFPSVVSQFLASKLNPSYTVAQLKL